MDLAGFRFEERGFRWRVALGVAVFGLASFGAVAAGQAVAPQTASYGSVMGRVVCSDTQAPARFAQVMLVPVSETTGGDSYGMGRREATRTDLDGQYMAANVPAGDYYVTATATGYVSEAATLQAALNAGADVPTLLARLPVVHVSAGVGSTANLTLDRGATIAGKVLWDDGSPAAGVQVSAIAPPAPAAASGAQPISTTSSQISGAVRAFGSNGGGYGTTDDRGSFRLTGLAAGAYLVRATLPLSSSNNFRGGFGGGASIAVYAPGQVRETDAKPLTLHAGEEHDDANIMLDLGSLHTVSGHVSSASDSLTLGSGTIRITDQTDPTLTRSATLAADGSFTLTYVPSGTYTLSVPYAASTTAVGTPYGRGGRGYGRGSSSFQPLTQTLSVTDTDVSGLAIALAPATASTAGTSPGVAAQP